MNHTREAGKTIGEVEKLTGIPKRKLKYFIEQKFLQPLQKSKSGYWLYREEEIEKARIICLCQELNYPNETIRSILADPDLPWQRELDGQIAHLASQKDRIEDKLLLAECLRSSSLWDSGLLQWQAGDKYRLCRFFSRAFSEPELKQRLYILSALQEEQADAPAVQKQAKELCQVFADYYSLPPCQLLLAFQLAHLLSGLVPVLDQLLGREGGMRFISKALQHYCNHLGREASTAAETRDKV